MIEISSIFDDISLQYKKTEKSASFREMTRRAVRTFSYQYLFLDYYVTIAVGNFKVTISDSALYTRYFIFSTLTISSSH